MTAATGITLLEQHPLSAAFPSIPEAELEQLADDIRKNGQRDPGVIYEGMVLDGWHRYLACQRAEVAFKTVEFTGDNPVAFVLSKNLVRRHLTSSQRAQAVVAAHNWRPRKGKTGQSAPVADSRTAEEMAREAEVSTRTIEYAKTAEKAGLGDAVREGRVSAKAAADVAKLPKGKREKALSAIESGESPARQKTDGEKQRADLIDLQGKYADLLEKNVELAETARELEDKLTAFETTEPDEQQKLIANLQLKLRRKDAEIDRLRVQIRDANNKNNELIRQVKRLQKHAR